MTNQTKLPMASPPAPAAALSRGRLLARNTLWSLLGQAIPMVAAAIGIPVLLRALGTEAFGILTISWTLIGYLTLFDLGLGRALTRVVAEGLGGGDVAELPALVGTALVMLLGLGLAGALVMWGATPWMVERLLKVPVALASETRTTFYLLAVSLPAVLVTAGLGGVLAAYQRFKVLNLIRMPMSVLSFVLPMAVLPYTHRLAPIVGTIVAVRFLGAVAHLAVCNRLLPELRRKFRWVFGLAVPLLKSGGWIAVINIIMPLFTSVDRVLVGAWTSVAVIPYYATPQDMATRMWILPGTLASVLFPAFAANSRVDPARVSMLFMRGLSQVYCALFPLMMVLIIVGGDVLRAWLGTTFEQKGQAAMRFMVAGGFFTGLSFIPAALIQAVGHPRKVGLLLIIEVPLFLAGLWWGVRVAGPTGAAVSWCVRALVDLIVLMILAIPWITNGRRVVRQLALPALGTIVALGGACTIQPLAFPARLAILALVVVPFTVWAVGRGLAEERRALIAQLFGRT